MGTSERNGNGNDKGTRGDSDAAPTDIAEPATPRRDDAASPPPAPILPRGRRPGPGWRLAAGARAGVARGFLLAWPIWERIKHRLEPVRPIPNAPYGLFLVRFGRYHGERITLPDGTTVSRGDHVCELHLDNHQLTGSASNAELLRQLRADLRALAAWAQRPDFPAGVRALYGFTLMSPGARRLGFITRDRPRTLKVKLDRFFLVGLLALYNARGVDRLRQGTTYRHYPQEIWMSRADLVRRYGAALDSAAAGA